MSSAVSMAQNQAAGDNTTRQLTCIWEDLLSVHPIEPDQNYFDLGGDSLLAVQMFAQIDKMFHVKLPVATLFEAPTIGELAQILYREAPKSRWSSVVTIQPKGSRPPFFCMHGAGGNVLIYRELSEHLGQDQPFYGLQSLGLDGSSEPQSRIEDMAASYVQEIRRTQAKGPYYLGGYCLGGTIAYEVAQQLRAQGAAADFLEEDHREDGTTVVPRFDLLPPRWRRQENILAGKVAGSPKSHSCLARDVAERICWKYRRHKIRLAGSRKSLDVKR